MQHNIQSGWRTNDYFQVTFDHFWSNYHFKVARAVSKIGSSLHQTIKTKFSLSKYVIHSVLDRQFNFRIFNVPCVSKNSTLQTKLIFGANFHYYWNANRFWVGASCIISKIWIVPKNSTICNLRYALSKSALSCKLPFLFQHYFSFTGAYGIPHTRA